MESQEKLTFGNSPLRLVDNFSSRKDKIRVLSTSVNPLSPAKKSRLKNVPLYRGVLGSLQAKRFSDMIKVYIFQTCH